MTEKRLYAPVDICETDDKILLWAEMPGVKKEDVEIRVEGNDLEIIGHLKESEEGKFLLNECPREGDYHRAFTLSDEIDTSSIKAKLVDGVLELTLPKKEQAKPREIPIEEVGETG
ncbi:Hsp20/alpha crystallin family protein [Candidatus Poribacteria bacterium]|nr:Hsp20/alpha crystallin family protein [Candidatus Poribacteria bacterium]